MLLGELQENVQAVQIIRELRDQESILCRNDIFDQSEDICLGCRAIRLQVDRLSEVLRVVKSYVFQWNAGAIWIVTIFAIPLVLDRIETFIVRWCCKLRETRGEHLGSQIRLG